MCSVVEGESVCAHVCLCVGTDQLSGLLFSSEKWQNWEGTHQAQGLGGVGGRFEITQNLVWGQEELTHVDFTRR